MKKSILYISLLYFLFFSCDSSETKPVDNTYGSFFAIIVDDMEKSKAWYTEKLGFKIINSTEVSEIGLKQANLKLNAVSLELIELKSAISLSDSLSGFNNKTKIKGFFKVGFTVTDFDAWVNRFRNENIAVNGSVVEDNITGKRMLVVMDIDGNRIQIFEG